MSAYLERPQARLLRDPNDVRVRDLRPLVPLLGIPWDWSTAGRPGARFSPALIRAELYSLPILSEDLGPMEWGFDDLGDVRVVGSDPAKTSERVTAAASQALALASQRGVPTVFIGGDHSVTGWTVQAALGRGVRLLVLDAHYDVRSVEEGVTSGSWLYELKARAPGLEVMIVGVSEYSNPPYERSRASQLGVRVISRLEVYRDLQGALRKVRDFVAGSRLYLSIDMDHIDQAFAPGVNSPNPLGMTPMESLAVIEEAVRSSAGLVAVDVAEVSPPYDVGGATSRLAARLLLRAVQAELSRSRAGPAP